MIGEEQGLINWPTTHFNDIDKFFEENSEEKSSTDFINRIHSKYKQGKAHRYFALEFVEESFYHKVSEFPQFWMLKTKMTHSQRISQKDYIVLDYCYLK